MFSILLFCSHDIAEILLKLVLNTNQSIIYFVEMSFRKHFTGHAIDASYQAVSEEKILRNRPIRNKNFL
jgi:hypothetical protein